MDHLMEVCVSKIAYVGYYTLFLRTLHTCTIWLDYRKIPTCTEPHCTWLPVLARSFLLTLLSAQWRPWKCVSRPNQDGPAHLERDFPSSWRRKASEVSYCYCLLSSKSSGKFDGRYRGCKCLGGKCTSKSNIKYYTLRNENYFGCASYIIDTASLNKW